MIKMNGSFGGLDGAPICQRPLQGASGLDHGSWNIRPRVGF